MSRPLFHVYHPTHILPSLNVKPWFKCTSPKMDLVCQYNATTTTTNTTHNQMPTHISFVIISY